MSFHKLEGQKSHCTIFDNAYDIGRKTTEFLKLGQEGKEN